MILDITTRKKAEQDVAHAATHDHLTGLLNRAAFKRHLDSAIDALHRHGDRFALMFIDLDGFKSVNDRHGHAAGDALLVELTRRMRASVRTEDVLARLGGDEFVVLTRKVDRDTAAIAIAHKLIASVAEPVPSGNVEMSVTASIGICFSADGHTADELLLRADTAMYQAKQIGKNRFCFASDF